jgi:hypothetical protein
MADVLYTINYDEQQGLRTSQHIERIGTSPDRVRFVTETDPKEYKMALQRDRKKNPHIWPLNGIPDPYPIPSELDPAEWIDVNHSGGQEQFHYICGYLDDADKFHKWPDPPVQHGKHGTAAQPAQVSSLPWPT